MKRIKNAADKLCQIYASYYPSSTYIHAQHCVCAKVQQVAQISCLKRADVISICLPKYAERYPIWAQIKIIYISSEFKL